MSVVERHVLSKRNYVNLVHIMHVVVVVKGEDSFLLETQESLFCVLGACVFDLPCFPLLSHVDEAKAFHEN